MPWIILLLPWLELWTLIELGAATSGLTALAWVLLGMIFGTALIRRQGEGMMRRLQELQSGAGIVSARWMMDDLALAGTGLLLVIPGLITDFLAIVLAIGPLRRGLRRLLGISTVTSRSAAGYTVEGEFKVHTQQHQHQQQRRRVGADAGSPGDTVQSQPPDE